MIVFFIVAIVGLTIGLGFLIYTVPKKLGYSQVAKYLTYAYGLIVLLFGIFLAFEDQLFTKNNAKYLVEEQEILLLDKFDLTENESMYAIGDYYHTFTLKISTRDKENAISIIRNAENFDINKNDSIDTLMYLPEPDRYFGEKITENYETENSFVREYFKPSGREGYAPTFRRIAISKTENELTFEDIEP